MSPSFMTLPFSCAEASCVVRSSQVSGKRVLRRGNSVPHCRVQHGRACINVLYTLGLYTSLQERPFYIFLMSLDSVFFKLNLFLTFTVEFFKIIKGSLISKNQ